MTDPRFVYLETQIATATPQKLRLMLIEGAIRHANAALEHWEQGRNEDGLASITRCRAIAAELLEGVRNDGTELTQRVIAIYTFLFETLHEAEFQRDVTRLADVLKVLQEERITWKQVCQDHPEAPQAAPRFEAIDSQFIAPPRVSDLPGGYHAPHFPSASTTATSGFSLEM